MIGMKKLVGMAVASLMMLCGWTQQIEASGRFSDVGPTYEEAVRYLVDDGITSGVGPGRFGTQQFIKRGDAAVFLSKVRKLDTADAQDRGFGDVNDRLKGYVNAVVKAGIASGKSPIRFAPDEYITRQEMAKMVASAYAFKGGPTPVFTDVAQKWTPYVNALYTNKIAFGKTDSRFAPLDQLTRGEFALFVHRAEKTVPPAPETPPVDADDPVTNRTAAIRKTWDSLRPVHTGSQVENTPLAAPPYAIGKTDRRAVRDSVNVTNFIRYLAYLPPTITVNEEFNKEAQAAALVNAANGLMTHTPKQPDRMPSSLYASGYRGAGTSNIGYGYSSIVSSITEGYMPDYSDHNRQTVGHRRWVLSPKLKEVGFGWAASPTGIPYTAMKVVADDMWQNPSVSYDSIAWPSKTAFPTEFLSERDPWSISLNDEIYNRTKSADIRVQLKRERDGRVWSFPSDKGADGFFTVSLETTGYLPYTIIFQPAGIETYLPGDTYEVTIQNVVKRDGTRTNVQYKTTFFTLGD